MKRIIILGATGSVGGSVLNVLRANPGQFDVVGLAAGHAGPAMDRLAAEFPHARTAVGSAEALRLVCEVDADCCVAAISGTAGLESAFAAVERGQTILLANKEVLVSAGELFMAAAARHGVQVLPLDSEHAALHQCMEGRRAHIRRVTITASGGPFRTWSADAIAAATPEQALAHPIWKMGAKISIDSATLANKAKEVIEAHHLFGLPYDAIDILVHPQSIVHGMVELDNGSVLAHMGASNMEQPVACMLFYPGSCAAMRPAPNLAQAGSLDFLPPDTQRFPLLAMGLDAGRRGGTWPAVFNAANETAVELFLERRICFADIVRAVEHALSLGQTAGPASVAEVCDIHQYVRRRVHELFSR